MLLVLAKEIFEWCLVAENIIVLAQEIIYTYFLVSESICVEKGFWGGGGPNPPPPHPRRSQRHLEISNKMESFPSYGSRIFFFTINEAILFFSTPLEPFYFLFFFLAYQHLCCSLPRQYDISGIYIGNFMTLASFFS